MFQDFLQNAAFQCQWVTFPVYYSPQIKLKLRRVRTGGNPMKKLMSVMAVVTMSTFMLAGCDSMSPREQRVGAAALGGAVGGGVGNKVGGGVGAAVGGGAGAAVGSKTQGGSNRNAVYSGVGGAIGSAVGKSVIGGNAGAAIGGAIGGGAGAAIEQKKR